MEQLLQTAEAEDLLQVLLGTLPLSDVCLLSRVSMQWARAAEATLRGRCTESGWQLPRRSRHTGVLRERLPWRSLYVSRACRACLCVAGDFAVRRCSSAAPHAFLCGRCAKASAVVERLRRSEATLDVTGLSGRPLYTRKADRFCSDVARLSKASLDAASGNHGSLRQH